MRNTFKTYFGYILAVAFLVSTIYLYKEVKASNDNDLQQVVVNDNTLERRDSLVDKMDSLLIKGVYADALRLASDIENQTGKSYNSDLGLRIKLLKEISRLQKKYQNVSGKEGALKSTLDSILKDKDSIIDSLKLALVNTEVDVYYLEKKVDSLTYDKSNRSFGDYLTFSTTKGKRLHFIGEVKNGMANGFGIAILETGSRYEGEWKDNMRHGKGKFYWDDGDSYKGEYKNDLRDGYGTYVFEDGQKYVGQWEKDMRDGSGKFYDEDGKLIAEGIWEKDELKE